MRLWNHASHICIDVSLSWLVDGSRSSGAVKKSKVRLPPFAGAALPGAALPELPPGDVELPEHALRNSSEPTARAAPIRRLLIINASRSAKAAAQTRCPGSGRTLRSAAAPDNRQSAQVASWFPTACRSGWSTAQWPASRARRAEQQLGWLVDSG